MSYLKPSSVRKMSEPEAAWVGAIIEGEGTVSRRGNYPVVSVANTDPEIISALLRATGVGRVYYQNRSNNLLSKKPIFYWWALRKNDVAALQSRLADYCLKLAV